MQFEENIAMENAAGETFAETQRGDAADRHGLDRCFTIDFKLTNQLSAFYLRDAIVVKVN